MPSLRQLRRCFLASVLSAATLPVLAQVALSAPPPSPGPVQDLLTLPGDGSRTLLPPGGDVRALALDPTRPQRMFLGASNGLIYRSDDAGLAWHVLSRVAPHWFWVISQVLVDPVHPDTLYAGLWSLGSNADGGVFISRDGGHVWSPTLIGHSVRALAQAPSDPSVLVAGALDGVYRSHNSGVQWDRISPENSKELVNIESIAIHPTNPDTIYIGTWHLPWKTFDAGANWIEVNQGVIDDSDVFAITLDQHHPETVYLSACSGIYRSDNAGTLFRKLQGIPYTARRTPAIVQDPNDPQVVFAGTTQGLWRSTDGGGTWVRTSEPDLMINTVLFDPRQPGRMLLGTEHAGVMVSEDDGLHFQASNRGFANRQPVALAWDAAHQRQFVAVAGDQRWGGVFATDDQGQTWQQLSAGWPGVEIYRLLWTNDTLLIGTNQGILRWSPAGLTPEAHSRSHRSVPLPQVRRLAGLPALRIYDLAQAGPERPIFAATERGLFVSSDQGASWHLRPQLPAPIYWVTPAADHVVFAAGLDFVLRSDDDGRSFPLGVLYVPGRINQIATGAAGDFVATSAGLYQSTDTGRTWTLVGHGLPQDRILALTLTHDAIYATTPQVDHVYRSLDAGAHWQSVPVPPEMTVLTRLGGVAALWNSEQLAQLAGAAR